MHVSNKLSSSSANSASWLLVETRIRHNIQTKFRKQLPFTENRCRRRSFKIFLSSSNVEKCCRFCVQLRNTKARISDTLYVQSRVCTLCIQLYILGVYIQLQSENIRREIVRCSYVRPTDYCTQ